MHHPRRAKLAKSGRDVFGHARKDFDISPLHKPCLKALIPLTLIVSLTTVVDAAAPLTRNKPVAAFDSEIQRFYHPPGTRRLWVNSNGFFRRSFVLYTRLRQAGDHGLDPEDYRLSLACTPSAKPVSTADHCEREISRVFLRYASDVGYGLWNASKSDPNWHIAQEQLNALPLLQTVARFADITPILDALPPQNRLYRQLQNRLTRLESGYSEKFIKPLPERITLRAGYHHPGVGTLRQLLYASTLSTSENPDPWFFDERLEEAVKAFQAHHGLAADGIVGPRTRDQLEQTAEDRLGKIRLNLERVRWLPRRMETPHVFVNLASFEADFVADETTVIHTRVIVGRTDRSTPAFSAHIQSVKFKPDWTVPRTIAIEDLLPMLQKDPGVLKTKSLQVFRVIANREVPVKSTQVDWSTYDTDNFPFILRQKPGVQNSLGLVKFNMNNPYSIFLHDTPQKWLFKRAIRTYSSGCIRVEGALNLAESILTQNDANSSITLASILQRSQPTTIELTSPLPVYLVYLTAWVDRLGNLQFRDDVYGRNVSLRDYFSML